MQSYTYYILNVFTEKSDGGNPLAVVMDSHDLSKAKMQKIAADFNLSETVFLSKKYPDKNCYSLKIFTPTKELLFAGHPIVGTSSLLALLEEEQARKNQELMFHVGGVDIPTVSKKKKGQIARSYFVSPHIPQQLNTNIDIKKLAEMLQLAEEDILTDRDVPLVFKCSHNFLFVPVRNKDAIKRCSPNLKVWNRYVKKMDVDVVYAFTYLTVSPSAHFHARSFCPQLGIKEDPATGSAVNALAGYICAITKNSPKKISKTVEQGYEMKRPSNIKMDVETRSGLPFLIRIGGNSVLMKEGEIKAPK